MFTRLSLRFRIFLFFCLMAFGGAVLAGGAIYYGWTRADGLPANPFIIAFAIFAFLNTGLAVGVWMLFDENVAKPINKLAADLRLRAHSGIDTQLDEASARYLGDLAPAASAMSSQLSSSVMSTASQVAQETARLQSEAARLTALLTEIPLATILANPADEIVLYDGQAASVLSSIAPPRLKAPLSDYFSPKELSAAQKKLANRGGEVAFTLRDQTREKKFPTRIKSLDAGGYMLIIDTKNADLPLAPRPLVFDFDLLETAAAGDIKDTPLCELCFVAFDTETTGLSVEKDDVIQLGAVRILNGRIVAGEKIDTYVDPQRPIPPASTAVHHICDDDVSGAPDFAKVGCDFHHFARDAVLVAHNAPFDIGLLRKGEADMGVTWDHPVLDTVLLSAVVFGTNESHTLDALCERLDIAIPPEARHTAYGDALATGEALVKLIPLLQGRGYTTFGEVVAQTQKHGRLLQDLNTG
ncbi:3'-5' exonuclease [Yoonia litorea]|uniref:DNA-directed DNA polymerase n=1 Tax=Yoonia litorea TaxID=1123755 RepID=A0A1I6L1I5_9RHOB|nr:3'-5' exonuclease [Yoonia litorea]SFR97070.1 DNA polymerase-3 subunit epsilon [Yoonia litorea]